MRYSDMLPRFAREFSEFSAGRVQNGRIELRPPISAERVILTSVLKVLDAQQRSQVDRECCQILETIRRKHDTG